MPAANALPKSVTRSVRKGLFLSACLPDYKEKNENASDKTVIPPQNFEGRVDSIEPYNELLGIACDAFTNNIADKYATLSIDLCGAREGGVDLDFSQVYFRDRVGVPYKVMDRPEAGVSRLGYLFPMFLETDAVNFYQYLMTGVMKKGVGSDRFDPSVTAYDFTPSTNSDPFVTSAFTYLLDYEKAFGDIQLAKSTLEMSFEWLHFPDDNLFLAADRSENILAEGLFQSWEIYIFFIPFGNATVAYAYVDMSLSNLGIHEVIRQEYLLLTEKLPQLIFKSIERLR